MYIVFFENIYIFLVEEKIYRSMYNGTAYAVFFVTYSICSLLHCP
jgi:hypothetical protein